MNTDFDLDQFEAGCAVDAADHRAPEADPQDDAPDLPEVRHAWFWESARTHDGLVAEHGDPFVVTWRNGESKISNLNDHYWTARFTAETLVVYEPHSELFYLYEKASGLWVWVTDETIQQAIAAYLLQFRRSTGLALLETGRTSKRLGFMLTLLRATAERREPFARAKGIVHLQNGMLDLNVDPPVLHEFSPVYFSLGQSPVAFDPQATCPRFLTELLYRALDPDDAEILRLMCGLFLLRRNHLQLVLLLVGLGGAGKGTIERVIAGVLGHGNIKQLRTRQLEGRFELDNLDQASLLVGSDVDGDFLSHAGSKVIKALTGGDPLTMETKGGRKREIRGEHNILITCNDRLRVKLDGDESAWKRRLVIIGFDKAAPETPLANFDEILLRNEAVGILNWMILGAVDIMEIVQKGGRLPLARGQTQRVEDLLSESDSLRLFVNRCVGRDAAGSVTAEELQIAYENFCADRGWVALNKNQAERQLGPLMMEFHRAAKRNDIDRGGKQRRGFTGVALRPGDQENQE